MSLFIKLNLINSLNLGLEKTQRKKEKKPFSN